MTRLKKLTTQSLGADMEIIGVYGSLLDFLLTIALGNTLLNDTSLIKNVVRMDVKIEQEKL